MVLCVARENMKELGKCGENRDIVSTISRNNNSLSIYLSRDSGVTVALVTKELIVVLG